MSNIRVISGDVAVKVLTLPMAVEAVERAYTASSSGCGTLWPMVFSEFKEQGGDMDIKSGCMSNEGIYGLKLVSWFGNNAQKNLPELVSTTLLFDINTGMPLALFNANTMTGLRTGAAGAVGAKHLARPESRTMLMVGAGNQSPYQIAAMLYVMKNIRNVRLANPFAPSLAESKSAEITEKVKFLLNTANIEREFELSPVTENGLEQAVGESDVITTATPAYEPMIAADWVKPGTHFSCIGSDMSGKEEINEGIFARARVFADNIEQAVSVGECELPVRHGIISKDDITEIGKVIIEAAHGRKSDNDVTVFDSTGIALQDLAVAKIVYDAAKKEGLGSICVL